MKKIILMSFIGLLSNVSFAQISIGGGNITIGQQPQQKQNQYYGEDRDYRENKHGPNHNASSRAKEVHERNRQRKEDNDWNEDRESRYQNNQPQNNGIVIDNNGIKIPGVIIK